MTREWIEPIYNRTYGNVQSAQYNPDQTNPKGCWNAVDLNRIEKNTAYCAEWMLEQRIVRTAPSITVRENDYWTSDMIPTKSEIDRILNNIRLLIELSSTNPAIASRLPKIYAATQINYVLANQIEFALDLMHNQPKLPLEYFKVTIANGIIKSIVRDSGTTEIINSNEALVAENEIVTIRGIPYGEYAQYQTFTYWSGEATDLALLEHYDEQETSFEMPWGRAITFTANFETRIPRTLTITNGYISVSGSPTAETGPSTGTYFAGDQIMIIANVAASGKSFYEWTGTQAGLDNIRGVTDAEDPSTAILTMPDTDVNLAPHYINAGQHSVTVNGGSGGGWYNYKDSVSIFANTPSHYEFSHWSGNTSYLENINYSFQSFQMGDENISFTAHFNYVYSYNSVQMINGLIRVNGSDVAQASGLRQTTSYQLVPTPPDVSQGIDYWEVEGEGSVSGNTFTVGDGNAIITGHYAPYRTLTVTNLNNSGGTNTYNIVQGHTQRISTNYSIGNYRFNGWYEDNTRISTSTNLDITMSTTDRTIEARYDYYETYTVTLVNKDNAGQTTTSQVLSGDRWNSSTSEEVGDYLLVGWKKEGVQVSTATSYSFYVSGNTTIEVEYRPKETYHLTVNNGTGSGDYKERQAITITADSGDFSHWTYTDLYSIASTTSRTTTVKLGRADGTVTANYNMRAITVVTNSGTNTYNVIQDNYRNIDAGVAPATYEFNHWEVTSGDATLANMYSSNTRVYAHLQDSTITAIYTPIPRFTVTMEDGYIWDGSDWVTSATLLRNSTNSIKMKPAPTGKQFLQWEVYVNDVLQTDANDVYEPLAETTRLRNLLRDITIKATYFTPDPEVKYSLSIKRKDGSTEIINDITVGTNVTIHASAPDTGMEFYKWTGDTAYLVGGITNPDPYVHMPTQNIQLQENYLPEGYIPEFKIQMTNIYGECCYETEYTDPETGETTVTKHWVSVYEHYKEGDTVEIRATGFSNEYYFNGWNAYDNDTHDDMRFVISELSMTPTTLTMPACNLDIDPTITPRQSHTLKLNDGLTGGTPGQSQADYRENARADVYFAKTNTNDIHYEFIRWTGSTVSQIELYDGGMFNVLTPGTANNPQFIKMPGQNTEITATYKTYYKLTLTGGTIDTTGLTEGFYENGSSIGITANPAPTGMRFQYWTGNTTGVANRFDPTTTVTITNNAVNLTAVYSTDSERNDIGYVTTDLKNVNTINNNDITIISGTVEVGFIITDSNGHIYVITNVDTQNNTSTIYRMTKIVQGGNIYG